MAEWDFIPEMTMGRLFADKRHGMVDKEKGILSNATLGALRTRRSWFREYRMSLGCFVVQ